MLEETTQVDCDMFYVADEFQMLRLLDSLGGDPATEWVADAVQHFIRCKYAKTSAISTAANAY